MTYRFVKFQEGEIRPMDTTRTERLSDRTVSSREAFEADLLIQNAQIRTFDQKRPLAQSLAALNGWIIGIGSNRDLENLAGPNTQIMDLGGRTVLPGFIDAHEHLSISSQIPLQLDLSPSKVDNLEHLLRIVQSEAKRLDPGEWIRGALYDDTKMREGRLPTRENLDAVAPDHPVIIRHVSGNVGVVNSAGLRRGGLDENSPNPKGGKLGRDEKTGRLTGHLFSNALFRFTSEAMSKEPPVVPLFGRAVRNEALRNAARVLNAAGVTSVNDAQVSPSYITSYLDVTRDRSLTVRVNMLISYLWLHELEKLGLIGNWGDERLRCTGVKLILDGAIAGRTAALREGYIDNPDDHGILIFEDIGELTDIVTRIHTLGYQVCLHANGDLAIEMGLGALETAQEKFPRADARHRIEHCTVINKSILSRMRKLGAIALPFGSYLWQHGEKIGPYYGQKMAETMFGHKSFLDAGVRVAGSSDHPAGLLEPLLGVQCMVTRRSASGKVIGENQRISLDEAFKMYTTYAAYASFEECIKGSLTAGRLADLVVLDQDPWTVNPQEIGQIDIHITLLAGDVVYRAREGDVP
jgi:predicted amidohydrolase YtcJ